jgi:S-adenosylmethionine:tRNA ribosyltransferase-isomerase
MQHPKHLSIADFNYELPDERIAKYPLAERDASKLLVYQYGDIKTHTYEHIVHYIPAESMLVFNNTKVVEARLLFTKATGGAIEIFCLEPDVRYSDITTAMLTTQTVYWRCLIGGVKKWKSGSVLEKTIEHGSNTIVLQATLIEKLSDCYLVQLHWNTNDSFAEVLHWAGLIPLPPYLHRQAEVSDNERYQTIYAKHDGSVAAPTAGLHFTERVLHSLTAKAITQQYVTLHVGAGTFKPVKAETMAEHEMHAEYIDVNQAFIEAVISHEHPIVAVGTTSLRTIETLYWMGVKCLEFGSYLNSIAIEQISIVQWDAYELPQHYSKQEAFTALLHWMQATNNQRVLTKTQIIIAPGYRLRVADGIITNFHQPQSTLLLLIAAVIGDDWKRVYDYALANDFRFLSYGDGSLLWKHY